MNVNDTWPFCNRELNIDLMAHKEQKGRLERSKALNSECTGFANVAISLVHTQVAIWSTYVAAKTGSWSFIFLHPDRRHQGGQDLLSGYTFKIHPSSLNLNQSVVSFGGSSYHLWKIPYGCKSSVHNTKCQPITYSLWLAHSYSWRLLCEQLHGTTAQLLYVALRINPWSVERKNTRSFALWYIRRNGSPGF